MYRKFKGESRNLKSKAGTLSRFNGVARNKNRAKIRNRKIRIVISKKSFLEE